MSRGIYWNTRPEEFLDKARAKAKACLKDNNPRLTALEKGFYDAFKKQLEC